MATLTAVDPVFGPVSYRDRKRWLWPIGLAYPLVALSGLALHVLTGHELLLALPLLIGYGLITLLDALLGADRSNPPEAVVPQLEADRYYVRLPMLTVPLHFIVPVVLCAYAVQMPLSAGGFVLLALTGGVYGGLGINTAHELGHKRGRRERLLARIALAATGYGHFCVEHNRGHHRDVATPEDPASARLGESIYRFARRELPGAWRRGLAAERARLAQEGKPFWHPHNEVLQSYALALLFQGSLVAWLGLAALPFLALHNLYAWWQLTSANYIEHYGLLRARQGAGYERCQPWHSWNADYVASNLVLYHLERHSDHHAYPMRSYQSLRSFPDLPTLPTGYFGMFLLALVPPLWYRLMDRRVLALPHVQGDLARVNLDPARRAELAARYAGHTATA